MDVRDAARDRRLKRHPALPVGHDVIATTAYLDHIAELDIELLDCERDRAIVAPFATAIGTRRSPRAFTR